MPCPTVRSGQVLERHAHDRVVDSWAIRSRHLTEEVDRLPTGDPGIQVLQKPRDSGEHRDSRIVVDLRKHLGIGPQRQDGTATPTDAPAGVSGVAILRCGASLVRSGELSTLNLPGVDEELATQLLLVRNEPAQSNLDLWVLAHPLVRVRSRVAHGAARHS